MSNYVLDKAYRAEPASGIAAGRVVVRGTTPEDCTLPAVANAGHVLGITTHSQPRQGRFVGVRRIGIALAEAAGVIECGAPVRIAGEDGRVAQMPLPRFNTGTVVANNALVFEWRNPSTFSAALVIEIAEAEETGDFEWDIQAGRLRLFPSWDSGIDMAASSFKAAIEADAALNALIRVSHATGSAGNGILAAETASAANLQDLINPVGVAEQAATQAGDLIDVLLTP